MQSARFKNIIHLHFIVFIWGFTAVLGKLISINALPLVWYRMLIATLLIAIYLITTKVKFRYSRKTFFLMVFGGVIVTLHWVTFFLAIKISSVSITLATLSLGAFFTALLEPVWYGRRIIKHEILLGLIVIIGLYLIFRVDTSNWKGMSIAAISAFLAATFSIINGKLVKFEKPANIAFVELGTGVILISIYILSSGSFKQDFFTLSLTDWSYLFILGSICTAYAFISSVKVMRFLSPYTVMLTTNLEPIYGILLAFIILGENKELHSMFYLGALIILGTVATNVILKNRRKLKKN